MNAFLDGGILLEALQVDTILVSSLVQSDASGLFIDILPVLVVEADVVEPTPVPAPGTVLLFSLGLMIIRLRRRPA